MLNYTFLFKYCCISGFQALAELLSVLNILVVDERKTTFLVLNETSTSSKVPKPGKQDGGTRRDGEHTNVGHVNSTGEVTPDTLENKDISCEPVVDPGLEIQVTVTNASTRTNSLNSDPTEPTSHNVVTNIAEDAQSMAKPDTQSNASHHASEKPQSHLVEIHSSVNSGDHVGLINSGPDIDPSSMLGSDDLSECGDEFEMERKSHVVSQLLVVYDLILKVQYMRLFNGSSKFNI